MQLFRFSSPAILSALVLLLNFSVFTHASPLSLDPRELTCPESYVSCNTYCCPPSHTCTAVLGCEAVTSTLTATSTTGTAVTASPTTTTSSASQSSKKDGFFSTNMIIAVATGGGIALLLLVLATWACHRKRQQGRALLAAYEAPGRQPYEEISLKNKKSTASFASAVSPPAPVVSGNTSKPGTPTSASFNVPQHTSTPPPDYKNGVAVSAIEKELGPRYPPQAFQGQDSPRTPTGSQRGPFPADILGSPRSSSLPPYSPARSAFGNTGSPRAVSPAPSSSFQQQGGMLAPTQATSPLPVQTTFSPTQTSFPPQNTPSPMQNGPSGFSFSQQGGSTLVASPPASPRTPSRQMFMPVEENHQHPANQELFLPVDGGRIHQQEQEMFSPVDEPSLRRQQQDHGYPMAY